MSEIEVNVGAHPLARAEARAVAGQAKALGEKIGILKPSDNPGEAIAFLVLGGLAMELYFKSFMIMARGGRVTTGHDLTLLYSQFPDFLKKNFEAEYARLTSQVAPTFTVSTVTVSKEPPQAPAGNGPGWRFVTFEDAVNSLAKSFVTFRYLFERVGEGWTYVPFPRQYVGAALEALEITYAKFERKRFTGKT